MHALEPIAACPTSITPLDGSDLEYVDNYKYLGVWLHCKLSFQTHIKHLESKIKSRVGFHFRKQSILHSCCQTYPHKTDHPTNPRLRRCNLQNSLQHSTQQTGCSLSQCHPFGHQSPIHYPPLWPVCSLVGWPSLHIRRQTHRLQVIYKSLLGKAPPYLSSLVTTATPTRSTRSRRYISLVIPKANTSFGRLSFQFSAANDWNELRKSLKLESYISLSNFKHQLSEQLTDHCTRTQPICKQHTQLPHPHIVTYPLALLPPSISTCTSSSAHLSLQS